MAHEALDTETQMAQKGIARALFVETEVRILPSPLVEFGDKVSPVVSRPKEIKAVVLNMFGQSQGQVDQEFASGLPIQHPVGHAIQDLALKTEIFLDHTETLLIVGVMYFVAITILTWLANIVDRKVNR